MKNSHLLHTLCACFFTLVTGISHAALIDRGGGMIYDTDLDVTWLQDANFCASNPTDPACVLAGASASGQMNWAKANTWADNLLYGGFEDWRLPTSQVGGCTGLGCTDNEMGHLLYIELQIGTINEDFSTISNRQVNWYWSGTDNPAVSPAVWSVWFKNGFASDGNYKSNSFQAMAVRDGDVVPQTTQVDIDIKPGSYPNSINLGSGGVTTVAILGSASFNVNDINTDKLTLGTSGVKTVGKTNKMLCNVVDVSGDFSYGPEGYPDGYDDLVCHFVTMSIVPENGNVQAKISGELNDTTLFEGTDSVNIVP